MAFSKRRTTPHIIDIAMDNQSVMETNHNKFVWVFIDKKNSLAKLTSYIVGDIARVVIFIKARKYFTHWCMITLRYSSFKFP